MAQMSVDYKLSIGQRITFATIKSGTLRYKGLVSFAPGIWCGIELDEADGENDGSVDNVRYFLCKKNHGHFCHVSEILSEPETDFDIFYDCMTFQDSELAVDSNNFKAENEEKEALCLMKSSDDSDDSLGIIDVSIMDKASEDEDYLISMPQYYPYMQGSEEDLYHLEPLETINFTLLNLHETINLNRPHVIDSSDKHDKKMLQMRGLTDEKCNLNSNLVIDSSEKRDKKMLQMFGLPDKKWNLNSTLVLNRTTEIEKKACFENEFSSKTILPFISTCPNSESSESPLHKTENSPKFASTPKHEINYTFTLDEDSLNSEQYFSPISLMNKTSVKYNAVEEKTVFPENVEQDNDNILPSETYIRLSSDTDGKEILNVTCNTEKLGDYHHELNKTTVLPYNFESDHNKLPSSETYTKLTSDSDEKNIFNAACSPEELGYEELLNELNKTFTNFTLNTTMSVSKGSEKTIEESQNKPDKTQTLNTTYEKEDQLPELPKINKHEVKETRIAQKSKIGKHNDNDSSSVITSISKYSETDKRNVRKSMTFQNKNIREKPDKNRRKTFGSKSSLSNDIALGLSQKQDGAYCGGILKTKANLIRSPKKISCDKSKKCLIKKTTGIQSMKIKRESIKSAAVISTSITKPSSRQTKKSKSTLQEEQKFLFDETLSLSKSEYDKERRAFEKSTVPPKRLSVKECDISKISSIPSSLMPRPSSSKIEESVVQEEEESVVQEELAMSLDKYFRKLNQLVVNENSKISPLMPRSSSSQTEESESTVQGEQDIIMKLNESIPDTEKKVSVKSEVPSKRLSVVKQESKISSIHSSLVPRPCSSKIEESQSTVREEVRFSLHKAKKPYQPELNTGRNLEKPKGIPRRFSEIKYEIPKSKCESSRAGFTLKTSLPVAKTKEFQDIHHSGIQEKRVLAPRNRHGLSNTILAPSKTTKGQSLNNPGMAPNLRALWLPRQTQSKKKDIGTVPNVREIGPPRSPQRKKEDTEDTAVHQNLAEVKLPPVAQSLIPLAANRKKDDDKTKLNPVADKSRKKNTLR